MRGEQMAKLWSREKLLELMREHKTQGAAAIAAGISRSTIVRLTKRYGIEWPTTYRNDYGNSAWKELGR